MALPSVSVVICTRNRPVSLARCVRSVCAQTVLPHEIIVVDDSRLPPVLQRELESEATSRGIRWRYLVKTVPGLTRSRNLALSQATGQIVQFLDDDAEAPNSFLEEIAGLFALDHGGNVAVLGGTLSEPALDTWGGRYWRTGAKIAGWWALGGRRARRDGWPKKMLHRGRVIPTLKVSGAALAVRRSVAYPPGFDEGLTGYGLGEDRELVYRLSRRYLVGVSTKYPVRHHLEPSGRIGAGARGYATTFNYCYILRKTVPIGLGEFASILWSIIVLLLVRLGFTLAGNPRCHLAEAGGMVRGSVAWIRHCAGQSGFSW